MCLFLEEEWQGYRAELAERLAKAREIGGVQLVEIDEDKNQKQQGQ